SLNSKYIHSNLAIRYLSEYVKDLIGIDVFEFTINQNQDFIASEIHKKKPDIIGFSTYIWNLEETLRVCEILKQVNPSIKILLGGPEVSYDPVSIMETYRFIDYIIYGEGEETFREFVDLSIKGRGATSIDGLVYREKNRIITNISRELIEDLNKIPSPY